MPSWVVQPTNGTNARAPRRAIIDDTLARQRAILSTGKSISSLVPEWVAGEAPALTGEEKPRGLWEQLTDPITNFVPGITGFLGDVAESAVAMPRLAIDLIKDQDLKRDERFSGLQSYLAHYAPAFNTIGTSFVHTGQRLVDPSRYADAIKEGRIVDAILEDVGNLAIAGSAAGKVLGAGTSISAGLTEGSARMLAERGATITPELPAAATAAAGSEMAGTTLLTGKPTNLVNLVDEAPIYTGQLPGRGLAGIAERAGSQQLAEGLGRAGSRIRNISSLGAQVGNAPAKPFAWAGRGLGRGLESTGAFPRLSALLQGEYIAPEALSAAEMPAPPQGALFNALRTGNRLWKTSILPTSPKWLLGNAVGNMLQSAIHSGVGPITLVKRMRQIADMDGGWRKLWENSGVAEWSPADIANRGLTHSEWQGMRDYMEAAPRTRIGGTALGRGVNRALRGSWKLNEFTDNLTRQAVYLEKLGQGVPAEAAVQTTLRSLGDFQRLSPVEKNIVREFLPFYTWLRHQTVATLRLPLQSPTRAAMLATLGQIYSDPSMQNELLNFVGSKFPLGGNLFFDVGNLSPLADVGESPFGPFDPRSIGSAISPILKFPISAATGLNFTDWQQLGRPPGTRSTGVFGDEPTAPLFRLFSDPAHGLGELGYLATQMGPAPVRSLRDLLLGSESRYNTGYAVPGETDPNKTVPRALLRGLNLPAPYTIDVEDIKKRLAAR